MEIIQTVFDQIRSDIDQKLNTLEKQVTFILMKSTQPVQVSEDFLKIKEVINSIIKKFRNKNIIIYGRNSNDEKVYKAIDELLAKKSFFDKTNTINYSQSILATGPAVEFIDLFRLSDVDVDFCTYKETGIVKYGAEVIEKLKKDKVNFEIRWDGVLKVFGSLDLV